MSGPWPDSYVAMAIDLNFEGADEDALCLLLIGFGDAERDAYATVKQNAGMYRAAGIDTQEVVITFGSVERRAMTFAAFEDEYGNLL